MRMVWFVQGLTREERVGNGRGEQQDASEEDSTEVSAVSRERGDGDQESSRRKSESSDGERDSGRGLYVTRTR
jgi:hypothetical protein